MQPDYSFVPILLVIGFVLWLVFLPTVIAFRRRHRSRGAILIANLFFGWTVIGWVLCLIWSLTDDRQQQIIQHGQIIQEPHFDRERYWRNDYNR